MLILGFVLGGLTFWALAQLAKENVELALALAEAQQHELDAHVFAAMQIANDNPEALGVRR